MTDIDLTAWTAFFDARVAGARGRSLTKSYVEYVRKISESGLPPIFEVEHLSSLLGLDFGLLVKMLHEPHSFYRSFVIPKRSGGIRKIRTPRPILLESQRWILKEILDNIEVNQCAHGFVRGRSIITNATQHLGAREMLKVDIEDFFPSLSSARVSGIFRDAGYSANVSNALQRLTTLSSGLPQGAPTSPALSNIACRDVDGRLSEISLKNNITYTRYADDLTFSGEELPKNLFEIIVRELAAEGLSINEGKTVLSGAGGRKIITGISISSGELKLPRRYQRELRKQVHFVVSRGIHAHGEAIENKDPLLLDRLLGKVNFWLQVSPESKGAIEANQKLRAYIDKFNLS
jgi:retron-type reverse transcriptase